MNFSKIDPPFDYPGWYYVLLGAIAFVSLWYAARVVLGRRAPTLPGLRLRGRPVGTGRSGPETPGMTARRTNAVEDEHPE
jgi:hypothetical protein